MKIFDSTHSPVQELSDSITHRHGISLFIKREDLNHPEIMGNKLRKLKYNVQDAIRNNATSLLSFGGAYSNHILALSAAGRILNLPVIAIIRGDELEAKPLNPTLSKVVQNGTTLQFVSRNDYRNKNSANFIEALHHKWGDFYLIPEGGTNDLAIKGVAEIMNDIDDDFDYISCACGTGGTLAGIIQGASNHKRQSLEIIGFQILQGEHYIQQKVTALLGQKNIMPVNWRVNTDFIFGGYAKTDEKLINFIQWFKNTHDIELDYIYTGKMMYGLYEMIKTGYFRKESKLLAIHTGGTQTAGLSALAL